MNTKPKVLVVGSFVMDQIATTEIVPCEGQTVLGKTFHKAPGGKGANQAVQAARLGANVSMVGKLGRDANGEEMMKVCKEAGIDVANVLYDDEAASGCAMIILQEKPDEGTQNRILVIPGTNMRIAEDEVAFLKDTIKEYDMVILQNEIPMQINVTVARYAYEAGVPVMLNSAPSMELPEELYGYLTYISPNETEIEDMTGIHIEHEGKNVNLETARKAADAVRAKGVKNVLITLGSAGAFLVTEEEEIYSPCATDIKAVDPTAAGDSFIGAFCVGVCLGWNWEKVLMFANQTAGLTVSGMGAMPSLPTLDKVKEEMEKRGIFMSNCIKSSNSFLETTKSELTTYIDQMDMSEIEAAANLIIEAGKRGNRLHISGIGKPGHIAGYISSLISSTGTPTYFLHGTEAVHGSCGQLLEGDIVIFISNSGETAEMKSTVLAIKNNGCKIIGVSGNSESWLAKESAVHLYAGVSLEGGPLNRAPRISILAETIVLQTLSVYLQSYVNISPQDYVRCHPGGALGQLREGE